METKIIVITYCILIVIAPLSIIGSIWLLNKTGHGFNGTDIILAKLMVRAMATVFVCIATADIARVNSVSWVIIPMVVAVLGIWRWQ